MHFQCFLWPSDGKKKIAYRQQNRIDLFFKLPMWSITVHLAQMAFQLPTGLFSLACHVAWMIYFQYTVLISNKFAIWINWKHEIMTIVFASLAVLLPHLCTIILYLRTKKGKLQKEEDDFRTKSSREMEKWRKRVKELWIGRERKGKILALWHGDCIHKARSTRAACTRFWNSSPQSMSTVCFAFHFSARLPCSSQLDCPRTACGQEAQPAPWHASPPGTPSYWLLHALERKPAITEPPCATSCDAQRIEPSSAGAVKAREFVPAAQSVGILWACNCLGLFIIVRAWCAEGSFFPVLGEGMYGLHFCFFPYLSNIFSSTCWCCSVSAVAH